ncbi:MAG: DUF202 domain-containing protein [Synechococcus sp.]
MTDISQTSNSEPQLPDSTQFEGLNNTELAAIRTAFARSRTDLAESRTDLAENRTELAGARTNLSETRTGLARDRNRLAAERTIMAWIRTSLSMISFGFGIDRFFKYLDRTQTGTNFDQLTEERILGLSLISLGVFALAAAFIQHWRTLKLIEAREYKYASDWSLGLVVAILLFFIGLSTYIPIVSGGPELVNLFSLDSPLIQNLSGFTIFAIMFDVGLNLPWEKVIGFWKQPALLGRSLLSTAIVPPIVVALVVILVPLPNNFAYALALFAACPAPPLLTRRAAAAGASFEFVASLQVTLALLAIVLTPLFLFLFHINIFHLEVSVFPRNVVRQIAIAQLIPLSIGLGLRTFWEDASKEIATLVGLIAKTLFALLILLALIISFKVLPSFGLMPFAVTLALTLVGLAIGHLIGRKDKPQVQSGIAVTTIARNLGLILYLATANQANELVPYILGIFIAGFIAGAPYSAWMKKQISKSHSADLETVDA